jgi:porin
MRIATLVLASLACLSGAVAAIAGAKDESAVEWLPFIPPGFNDWRNKTADKGFAFNATYIGDTIGNASGGTKRGVTYGGRFDFGVDADLDKLVGWTGAKLHANMLQIHGRGMTRDNIHNLATISEIEALPDTRLYEAYIEQTFGGGAVSLKVGQQAADAEFFDSKTDDLFVNGTFGWPAVKAADLPAGGPAPPIAAVGARLKAKLGEKVTAFAAIFNGNAANPGTGDPQLRDNHGLAFRVKDNPWLIGQIQFDHELNIGKDVLPGNITPGGWYHTGQFDDQRFTGQGLSIADPSGSGVAARVRGNYGIYVVGEQMLYRAPTDTDKGVTATEKGITIFARAAYSPPDRNLIDFYADGGIGFNGMLADRPLDRFGAAIAFMHISPAARNLDRDTQLFSGVPSPVRSSEVLIELIYEAHIKPGWLLQPFFQYVIRPGGGIPNPNDATGVSRIGNAAVFGLTTTLKY